MGNRRIYREIAKEHGVSMKDVKHDMQEALVVAYTMAENQNRDTKEYQMKVPKKGEIPTPDEIMNYVEQEIKMSKKDRFI